MEADTAAVEVEEEGVETLGMLVTVVILTMTVAITILPAGIQTPQSSTLFLLKQTTLWSLALFFVCSSFELAMFLFCF